MNRSGSVDLVLTVCAAVLVAACGDSNGPTTPPPAVAQPPAAPTGLTATVSSPTQIDLTWTDNASNEDGYRIERAAAGTTTFTEIGIQGAFVAEVAFFWSTGLSAATAYSYRVRAYNAAGSSPYSNTATTTTQEGGPLAPEDVTGEWDLEAGGCLNRRVPVHLVAESTGALTSVYNYWQDWDHPITYARPLDGGVNLSNGAAEFHLYSFKELNYVALFTGTMQADGSIGGTFTDPMPGFDPLFHSSGETCIAPVTGHKRPVRTCPPPPASCSFTPLRRKRSLRRSTSPALAA